MSTMGTMIVVALLLGGWRMFTDASTNEHLRCSAEMTTDDEFIANKKKMLEAMHVSTAGVSGGRLSAITQTDHRYGLSQQLGSPVWLHYRFSSAQQLSHHLSPRQQQLGLYGKSWCKLGYTDKECVDCLGTAVVAIKEGCGNALRVEYNGTYCGVRYADYPF